jgi:hypothetical protein
MRPDGTIEKALLETDERSRLRIVQAMAARCADRAADPGALTTSASAELEAYARELLRDLTHAVTGTWDEQTLAWISDRHDECLAKLATALRDLMRESGRRHDIAQALQQKVLEAELFLGAALDAHTSAFGAHEL